MSLLSIFRDRGRFHPTGSPRSFNIPLYERKAALAPKAHELSMRKIG
jgi:hypothetical protein